MKIRIWILFSGFTAGLILSLFGLVGANGVSAAVEAPESLVSIGPHFQEDQQPPLVAWALPVEDGEIYEVSGEVLLLQAEAEDDVAVDKLHFSRWDAVAELYVAVGIAYEAPYQVTLETEELNEGWNQIFVRAYDTGGNGSPSKHIWLILNSLGPAEIPTPTPTPTPTSTPTPTPEPTEAPLPQEVNPQLYFPIIRIMEGGDEGSGTGD